MVAFERFIDRADKEEILKSCPDFRIRAHGMPPTRVFYYFLAVPVATILLLVYMGIKASKNPEPFDFANIFSNHQVLLAAIGILISIITVFCAFLIKRIRNIIMHTEYQNMIFSSAMRAKSDFCVIMNENRKTLFFDDKFARIFNVTDKDTDKLELILAHGGIKKEDKEKIKDAVEHAKNVVVPATIEGKEENIEILPLARPLGCTVIRALKKSEI